MPLQVSTSSLVDHRLRLVMLPFFISGLAALTYQVAWQRLMFVAFGVDLESVTIIVSAFMLGLGSGALMGGRLADRYPEAVIPLFALAEISIGIFGLLSPALIAMVGASTVQLSILWVAGANFLLLLLPTSLMGATLPMLVAFLVRSNRNVGLSIGALYAVNTLGAALGAGVVSFLAFHWLDLLQTIRVAAALNFFAGVLVLWLFRGGGR